MEDGALITANFAGAGGTGRNRFELFDWDGDGRVHLLIGTPPNESIPNPQSGLPRADGLCGAAVLCLKNMGIGQAPEGRFPVVFRH